MTRKPILCACIFLALAGCAMFEKGDDPGGGDVVTRPVALRFSTAAPAGKPVADRDSGRNDRVEAIAAVTATDGKNTIVVDEVRLTLEDIDLERAEQTVDCGGNAGADHLDCSDSFAGPVLLDLALDGSATSLLELQAPVGTFDEVSFDISVPDGGDPAQIAYIQANPDMADISILVRGSYNAAPFEIRLDLYGDLALPIDPPLVVAEASAGLEVVVRFAVETWFFSEEGILIDPSLVCPHTTDCAERTRIEANVELSVEAYSD